VIAPNLIKDLGLNAEMLGTLGGAFFYSFALLQIPMGPMLDRVGARKIMILFACVGAVGAFLFALGETFAMTLAGRILIGAGMACALMGPLKVFTLRFSPDRFATVVGLFMSVGTIGSVCAASPLAYGASTIGWRMTFIAAGAMTLVFGFFAFWALGGEERPDETFTSSADPVDTIGLLRSVRLILGSLGFWQIAAVTFFRYGTFMALQGLWLGPYLVHAKGFSPLEAGHLLVFLALGTILGSPFAGRLSDRVYHARKPVALSGLALYGVSLVPLTGILEIPNAFCFSCLFFLMGFFNGFGVIVYSHTREMFPLSVSATAMAWVNFFTMAGGAVFMTGLGKVIERFPRAGKAYPPEAYGLAFFICFLCMTAGVIFYAFSKEKPRTVGIGRLEGVARLTG
jgi:MFS family permease